MDRLQLDSGSQIWTPQWKIPEKSDQVIPRWSTYDQLCLIHHKINHLHETIPQEIHNKLHIYIYIYIYIQVIFTSIYGRGGMHYILNVTQRISDTGIRVQELTCTQSTLMYIEYRDVQEVQECKNVHKVQVYDDL